ncbi:hypothetical protein H696_03876 [Fonticula alba]|uniref:Translation machinery-associated protein 16 n=1 Tax=Fonticula alba TaxID=691883 RepID=A0A058Z7F6_FONAL|nr:hypothetical protein H696_03876 [Fonticula alba]KCV69447.1 hypothetical protein H696_03876 [Fonticula alba]|eukprot:XP_009496012.1 hypothetical protein H696_03876 [Fonticula alba]
MTKLKSLQSRMVKSVKDLRGSQAHPNSRAAAKFSRSSQRNNKLQTKRKDRDSRDVETQRFLWIQDNLPAHAEHDGITLEDMDAMITSFISRHVDALVGGSARPVAAGPGAGKRRTASAADSRATLAAATIKANEASCRAGHWTVPDLFNKPAACRAFLLWNGDRGTLKHVANLVTYFPADVRKERGIESLASSEPEPTPADKPTTGAADAEPAADNSMSTD